MYKPAAEDERKPGVVCNTSGGTFLILVLPFFHLKIFVCLFACKLYCGVQWDDFVKILELRDSAPKNILVKA